MSDRFQSRLSLKSIIAIFTISLLFEGLYIFGYLWFSTKHPLSWGTVSEYAIIGGPLGFVVFAVGYIVGMALYPAIDGKALSDILMMAVLVCGTITSGGIGGGLVFISIEFWNTEGWSETWK